LTGENIWRDQFFGERARLIGIARKILGSNAEAEDALQETWLRTLRTNVGEIQNTSAWLTTVTSRICLDILRSRKSRAEVPHNPEVVEKQCEGGGDLTPESALIQSDLLAAALSIIHDKLTPSERVALVLHDSFDVEFEAIGQILGRTASAVRQMASRARRRLLNDFDVSENNLVTQKLVEAFLIASQKGDLHELISLLAPNVVLTADAAAVAAAKAAAMRGAPSLAPEIRGAAGVAKTFLGRAQAARISWIENEIGAVWIFQGTPRAIFLFEAEGNKIVSIDIVSDAEEIGALRVVPFD
jgi:RNA polymerase sigma factor (sigma-70 family)